MAKGQVKYKQTGIDWMPEVPEHWEIYRLKNILGEIESGSRPNVDVEEHNRIFSLGGEHVGFNGEILEEMNKYISKEYYESLNRGKVKQFDTLLVKDGATIGKCVYVYEIPFGKAALNEHVFRLESNKNCNSKYLYYLIISRIGQEQIKNEIKGSAQGGISNHIINIVKFGLPSISEQEKNINYLDIQSEKINHFIQK